MAEARCFACARGDAMASSARPLRRAAGDEHAASRRAGAWRESYAEQRRGVDGENVANKRGERALTASAAAGGNKLPANNQRRRYSRQCNASIK